MISIRKTVLAVLLLAVVAVPVRAASYKVDPDHSSVSFKIRHLLSNTQGLFKKFEGTIDYEPGKPESWKAEGVIDVASIDTGTPKRDQHLLTKDFFEVEKYPTIAFKTTKVLESSESAAKIEGLMTMHGVEKPVVLDVQLLGVGKDPWGNTRAAFSAVTKINRKDFGIEYNQTLETGGLMLGEDVAITLEIEAIQQA
jgi:polyisoprenoid-binding protein YceI